MEPIFLSFGVTYKIVLRHRFISLAFLLYFISQSDHSTCITILPRCPNDIHFLFSLSHLTSPTLFTSISFQARSLYFNERFPPTVRGELSSNRLLWQRWVISWRWWEESQAWVWNGRVVSWSTSLAWRRELVLYPNWESLFLDIGWSL